MRVALASDHVGIDLKLELAERLAGPGLELVDLGPPDRTRTDYPIYGSRAAHAVAHGEVDRAIVICGTGVGISITANKVPGVRCVLCTEPYTAAMSRHHNDTNVLALGARVLGTELAEHIARVWLETPYDGGRHTARLAQITAVEGGTIL